MEITDRTLRVISFADNDFFYRRAYLHHCSLQDPPYAVVLVTGFGTNDFTAQYFHDLTLALRKYDEVEANIKREILNYLGATE